MIVTDGLKKRYANTICRLAVEYELTSVLPPTLAESAQVVIGSQLYLLCTTATLLNVQDDVTKLVKDTNKSVYDMLIAIMPMFKKLYDKELSSEMQGDVSNIEQASDLLSRMLSS